MHAHIFVGLLGLAGLALSLYLTVVPAPEFCDITSFISCDKVLSSPYAKIAGIPTSLYGAVWFTVMSTAAFLAVDKKEVTVFMKGWTVLGLLGVAVLVYVEFVLINAVCILCTAAHLLAVLAAVTIFLFMK
jgi:uncharacterized membrane protein